MTTTTDTTSTTLKVQILKHLVAGRDLDFVARITRLDRDQVLDVVSAHGYPDTDKMAWAVDVLTADGNTIPVRTDANPHRGGVPLDPPTTNIRSVQPPAAANAILGEASRSAAARTRNLGVKIAALLGDLSDRLATEQEAAQAKKAAVKEFAATAARIAELEAEIRKLKGRKPKPPTAAAVSKAPTSRKYGRHPGEYECVTPGCDRTFDTSQGVHLHQRRAHAA